MTSREYVMGLIALGTTIGFIVTLWMSQFSSACGF